MNKIYFSWKKGEVFDWKKFYDIERLPEIVGTSEFLDYLEGDIIEEIQIGEDYTTPRVVTDISFCPRTVSEAFSLGTFIEKTTPEWHSITGNVILARWAEKYWV